MTQKKTDAERLNWLETQVVNVRTPLVYGSRDLFWSSPEDFDGDTGPSDIRSRIDLAIQNETGRLGYGN